MPAGDRAAEPGIVDVDRVVDAHVGLERGRRIGPADPADVAVRADQPGKVGFPRRVDPHRGRRHLDRAGISDRTDHAALDDQSATRDLIALDRNDPRADERARGRSAGAHPLPTDEVSDIIGPRAAPREPSVPMEESFGARFRRPPAYRLERLATRRRVLVSMESRRPSGSAALAFAVTSIALATASTITRDATAQIRISEVLASNRTTNVDDDGESSDWVEIVNAGAAPVDLAGWGISDDLRDLLRWTFPERVVAPGEHVLVWCSGKDRTTPSPAIVEARDSPIELTPRVLDLERAWRYLVDFPEAIGPPAGWFDPGFDDRLWPNGLPGFGYGDDDDRTLLPEGIGAVFLRTTFVVEDPSRLQNLVVQANYDDGFVLFLNGERVLDANYRGATEELSFASIATASREARTPQRWIVDDWIERLRPGENHLAAALLNRTVSSADLSFMLEIGTVPPVFHTNFQIERDGELLFLYDPRIGDVADAVSLPAQTTDHSYGRPASAPSSLAYLLLPTPEAPNDSPASVAPIPESIEFSPAAGVYGQTVELVLTANVPVEGFEVRYTRDGAPPTATSALYEGPISLTRSTVVRANGFVAGRPALRDTARSYFVTRDNLVLPRLSISMHPTEFTTLHNNSGARGIASERPGFLEVFRPDGTPAVATGFGLRLHGGAGRNGGTEIKKAYKAYFRGAYGDTRLRYPLIPDTEVTSFDKLVLRSNFNDAFRTGVEAALIRDQVLRDLHAEMGAPIAHGSWHSLFVNMQYRGVYNVVERMDRKFFASYFPEDGDNWDVIKTGDDVLDGDSREWSLMLSFFRNNNLANDELYARAQEFVDIENFTSYMILNIWSQNQDWPHNNWYATRPRRPDGRWIFLMWDAEFGLGRVPGGYSTDTFAHVISRNTSSIGAIFVSLLRNPRYGVYFLEKLDEHLAGVLSPANVLRQISRHSSIVDPDVPEEVALTGNSYSQWRNNITAVQTFAQRRGSVIRAFCFNAPQILVPRVVSASPSRLVLNDTDVVRLTGFALTADIEVEVGGARAEVTQATSSRQVTVRVPALDSLEGFPSITVRSPTRGEFTTRNALEVIVRRPTLALVVPGTGSAAGGEVIRVFGSGFAAGARVEFGSVPSPSVELEGDTGEILRVVTPPGTGEVEIRLFNTTPFAIRAAESMVFHYEPSDAPSFLRGDCDGDRRVTIGDAVCVLRGLFRGAGTAACERAGDANDDGGLNLADAVAILDFLFRQGAAIALPFPRCGQDATPDALACATATCP